jgi:hypothetical protein
VTLPLPNYTLNITPPGGSPINYTLNLSYAGASNQISIQQNFGRQGDRATLVLTDDWQGRTTPNFTIPVLSQVSFIDNTLGASLFSGVVTAPMLIAQGANLNEWVLDCTDYTFYADNALVAGTFVNQTIDQIVVSLTQQANCGITAATVANGGFVAPAPSITSYSTNWTKLSSAWRTLAQLASSSTPYGWYVDQNRALHFFDSSTALSSNATFTTSPTVGGSTTEGHIGRGGSFGYNWDGGSIRNRILVQGANQTVTSKFLVGTPTNTWQSNGVQDSWGLKYTVTGAPALTLNGATTNVVLVNAGATSTATWQVVQNANGQWYLVTSSVPKAGTIIRLWYNYLIPITAQANDTPSQTTYTGPNGGVYSEFIQDTTITTAPMALARAQREKTEYAFAVERATFDTTEEFFGYVRAGETFGYHNALVPDSRTAYSWGLTGTFICTTNTVSFTRGGYRSMTVTGVRI